MMFNERLFYSKIIFLIPYINIPVSMVPNSVEPECLKYILLLLLGLFKHHFKQCHTKMQRQGRLSKMIHTYCSSPCKDWDKWQYIISYSYNLKHMLLVSIVLQAQLCQCNTVPYIWWLVYLLYILAYTLWQAWLDGRF